MSLSSLRGRNRGLETETTVYHVTLFLQLSLGSLRMATQAELNICACFLCKARDGWSQTHVPTTSPCLLLSLVSLRVAELSLDLSTFFGWQNGTKGLEPSIHPCFAKP